MRPNRRTGAGAGSPTAVTLTVRVFFFIGK
jgi:hypothetical protein